MKIIHTSDWHLGQLFHSYDRTLEHEAFLEWLLGLLIAEKADALVVAGDLYDVANPSSASQKLLAGFIARAHSALPQLRMAIAAGNHDSGQRLESPGALAEAFHTKLIGNLPRCVDEQNNSVVDWERLILPLPDATGEVRALCACVPFVRLEEWSLFRSQARDKYGVDSYAACMRALYDSLGDYLAKTQKKGQRLVVMGHLHVAGGSVSSESERPLFIGGEEAVGVDLFRPEWDYVALGHLHKAQKVGRETVRYSGSPMPLSYAERDYKHGVVIVEWEADQPLSLRRCEIPRHVDLIAVPSQPAAKTEALAELLARDWNADLSPELWPYVVLRIRLDGPDPDLRADVDRAIEGLPIRLVKLDLSFHTEKVEGVAVRIEASAGLEHLSPQTVFGYLCADKLAQGQEAPAELIGLFDQLVSEALQNQPQESGEIA